MTRPIHALPKLLKICRLAVLVGTAWGLLPTQACSAAVAFPRHWAGASVGEDGAARAAMAHSGGKVVSVRTTQEGGRTVYEVTVLRVDGQVVVLRVDGQSGAVIGG